MRLVESFTTTQCDVEVYDTGYEIDFYQIYMIKSYHRKIGKCVTRFGSKAQINQIIKTYNLEKRFKLWLKIQKTH